MTQAWHSQSDYFYRCIMMKEISVIFDGCPELYKLRDWKEKRPSIIRKLELALYLNTSSLEDYMDMTTLRERLKKVAFDLQLKKMSQQQSHIFATKSGSSSWSQQPSTLMHSQDVISSHLPLHYTSVNPVISSINGRENFLSSKEEFFNVFDHGASAANGIICDNQPMHAYNTNKRVSSMLPQQHPSVNQHNLFTSPQYSLNLNNTSNMSSNKINCIKNNIRESNLHEFHSSEHASQPRQSLNISHCNYHRMNDPSQFLHRYRTIIDGNPSDNGTNGHSSTNMKNYENIFDSFRINQKNKLLEMKGDNINKIENNNRRYIGNICQLLGRSSNEEDRDVLLDDSQRDVSMMSDSVEKKE